MHESVAASLQLSVVFIPSALISISLIITGVLTETTMLSLSDFPISTSVKSTVCGSTAKEIFSFMFSVDELFDLFPNNKANKIITTTNAAPSNIH